ncbi:PA domain [Dillenia turbinata]|uniref:PA domain n=1 Tax=Dillenia turbinata TaxID=194707 RepID=A0AAN8ZS60_9MAGN
MGGNLTVAACIPGSLQNIDVKGKIVLCKPGGPGFFGFGDFKGRGVKDAGGVGMIVTNYEQSGNMTYPTPHVLPTTTVSYAADLLRSINVEGKVVLCDFSGDD